MTHSPDSPSLPERRRWLALSTLGLGAAGLGVGLLAAPETASAQSCAEDTLDRIKRTGAFNMGVRDAAPPYGFKDASGQYVGFATDLARAIYDAVNAELGGKIQLNLIPVTSQTRIPLLQNDTIDMEAGATVVTQARTKVVDFVMVHFLTSTEVLVPVDSPIKTLADMAGKRIGIPQGGLEEARYRAINAAHTLSSPVQTIGFPDHPQGFTALQTGSIDAYSSDGPIVYGLGSDATKWRVFDPGINTFLQAFPIRPESSKFKHIADVTLANLYTNGGWTRLYDTYFGPKSPAPFPMTDTLKALVVMNAWPVQ
jgi:glutamate/aspartate transport system substrate-binding protein